ncbi:MULTISPECIES: Gfo/Idh/MocA family oxidoreductase [unclassified Clostridium]|uniref:Gfo/Idh/MocA family protein n=1 Tax=unclassified Clostridium TaxID=2614128 RepID=UPI000297C8D7|nr:MULTISPECIES: Gfo/Idh/MocA family oxidoreductase [unclassified Clostridium]EKQ54557.1 MAG: putative dehydrogenase [Clostridium sp. Maddingley MBC34-26]
MSKVKMGILGAGNIAGLMAETISKMDNVDAYAVAARDLERAEKFSNEYGFEKAYGSYEEMLKDENIDLVYIATPHSHHYEHAIMCLNNGKHVLCEKAFTANAKQAEEVMKLAESKGLLITEAIWTRYMPMAKTLNEVIESGVIGKVTSLNVNLGYVISHKERIMKPELAGGALLDIGVYTINFAAMVFGDKIKNISSTAIKTESGVDAQNSITICFEDGRMAILNSSILAITDRQGVINGDKGYIVVENINNYEKIRVFSSDREEIAVYDAPKQITGYEYEVEVAIQAIENKEIECPQMPHKETLRIMKIMDSLRHEWGVIYPFEQI